MPATSSARPTSSGGSRPTGRPTTPKPASARRSRRCSSSTSRRRSTTASPRSTTSATSRASPRAGRARLLPRRNAGVGRGCERRAELLRQLLRLRRAVDARHDRSGDCPTLFHFGNNDPYIPNEGVDQIGAAIAGQPGFELNVETAGHAFDNHEARCSTTRPQPTRHGPRRWRSWRRTCRREGAGPATGPPIAEGLLTHFERTAVDVDLATASSGTATWTR